MLTEPLVEETKKEMTVERVEVTGPVSEPSSRGQAARQLLSSAALA